MAAASAIGEWPSLVKGVFLTQNKNKAGIFALRVFVRGKPHVISVDDSIMFSKYGSPIFAQLSDDGASAWGLIAEKVYAKVKGNYLKTLSWSDYESISFLTGSPYFSYNVNNSTSTTIFTLLNASVRADYLL